VNEYDYLKCSSCKSLKRTQEFYPANNDRGFRYYCKSCEEEKRNKRRDKQNLYYKDWYSKNKDKFKKKKISYNQDVNILMKKNVRDFFFDCVKNNKNEEQFKETFGYELKEVRNFESNFKKGMRWSNMGTYWNIYQTIPETAYNFSNEEEIKKCWNIKNLNVLLNEEYKQESKINISFIKENGLLDLMPEFIILDKN